MAASILCGNDVHDVIVSQFIFKKNARKKTLNLNHKCASQVPLYRELYDPGYEHDGCGVGFVANINSTKLYMSVMKEQHHCTPSANGISDF